MSEHTRDARARAEKRFAQTQRQAVEEAGVKSQRDADAQAVDDKTAKLRALRLAKERPEG